MLLLLSSSWLLIVDLPSLCVVQVGESNSSLRGTPYYMAPEVIMQSGYGRKSDIWSVGCTILQMITGQPPWKTKRFETPTALMFHIANSNETPPMPVITQLRPVCLWKCSDHVVFQDNLSDELQEFLQLCFQRDPAARPSAAELLDHPFITKQPLSHQQQDPSNTTTDVFR